MSVRRLPLLWGTSPLLLIFPQTTRWSQRHSGRIYEAFEPVLRQRRVQATGAAPILPFPGTQGLLAGGNPGDHDPAPETAKRGQRQQVNADVFHPPEDHRPLAPILSQRISCVRAMATITGPSACCNWRSGTAGQSGRSLFRPFSRHLRRDGQLSAFSGFGAGKVMADCRRAENGE